MEPQLQRNMNRIQDVDEKYVTILESTKENLLNLLTYSTKTIENVEESVGYLRHNVGNLQYKAGVFMELYAHTDLKQDLKLILECKKEFEETINSSKEQLDRLKRNQTQLETNSLNDLDHIESKIQMLEDLHTHLNKPNSKIYSEQDLKDKVEITQAKLYEKISNLSQDIFDIEIKLRNCVEALNKHGGLSLLIQGSEFGSDENAVVVNLRDAPPERKIQVGSDPIMQKAEDD